MSDQIKMRRVYLPYSEQVVEFPDDGHHYAFYRLDGHLLIYRCEELEDGSLHTKTLWKDVDLCQNQT